MKKMCQGWVRFGSCVAAVMLALGAVSVRAATVYVATNSIANGPGTAWANAFRTIQAAVDVAASGDTVLVTNGVYATGGAPIGSPAISNRVCITNDITVQSVNGAAVTFIKGAADSRTGGLGTNATRCVFMSAGSIIGFTLTNGYTRTDNDWNTQQGGGGALVTGGSINNCVVTGCKAAHFGGGLDLYGGAAWNCVVTGNTGYDGGGILLYGTATAYNCLLRDNRASNRGGGVFFWQSGTLGSCTVAGNSATNGGGGAYFYQGGVSRNSILYFNTTNGVANNWTTNGSGFSFDENCTTPALPGDLGGHTDDPRLMNLAAGDCRLKPGSPCIDHAADHYVAGANDLAGNPRIINYWSDIGAYEYTFPSLTITNSVTSVPMDQATIVLGGTSAYLTGLITYANAANGASGSLPAQTVWTTLEIPLVCGPNQITVTGTNYAGAAASPTITITRQQPSVTYVALGGSNLPPYTTWANAATTIQAAVDVTAPGGTVWVSNGVYATGGKVTPGKTLFNRVCLTANITVQSVNGPTNTIIVGAGPRGASAVRGAYLSAGVLSGFTLTNGNTLTTAGPDFLFDRSGGGALLNNGGTLSNCIVSGSSATEFGGGVCLYLAGTLNDSTIRGNTTSGGKEGAAGGGGVACAQGGTVNRCLISGNTATKSALGGGLGGGVILDYGGACNSCIISNNSASINGGGGVEMSGGGRLNNSTICYNTTSGGGGGVQFENSGGAANNCLVYANTGGGGGGAYLSSGGVMNNCTLAGNTSQADGGGASLIDGGTLNNCIVSGNTQEGAWDIRVSGAGTTVRYTCSPGLSGSGNLTNAPLFMDAAANNYQLLAGSPCLDAGTNETWMTGTTDLDGSPRIFGERVDMGAYEWFAEPSIVINTAEATVFDPIDSVSVEGTTTNGVVGTMWWTNTFSGASGTFPASSSWTVPVALIYNQNSITVFGSNTYGTVTSDNVTFWRHATNSPGHYVWANSPSPAYPYTNWDSAAHVIQDAIDVASTGDTVWVTNGLYSTGGREVNGNGISRVELAKAVALRSVNGPDVTAIVGQSDGGGNGPSAIRCVRVGVGGSIDGFTLTNGFTRVAYAGDPNSDNRRGGGVALRSGGSVSNCIIRNCAAIQGAGAFLNNGGTLDHCIVQDCSGGTGGDGDGGGAYVRLSGSVRNSLFIRNRTSGYGGGIYGDTGGTFENCTLTKNEAAQQGGGFICENSFSGVRLRNCIIYDNSATNGYSNWRNLTSSHITYSCTYPIPSGATGCFTNAPQFVSASDWHLQSNSPCINTGDNSSAQGATDLEGNPRIIGGVVDMGAYESTSGSTANGIPWSWLLNYGLATDGSADHQQSDTDTFDNLQEYVADLNPTNPASFFRITAISNSPATTVSFVASAGRAYTLIGVTNLSSSAWLPVPGAGPRLGTGGQDSLSDTNVPPKGPFYKLQVELP